MINSINEKKNHEKETKYKNIYLGIFRSKKNITNCIFIHRDAYLKTNVFYDKLFCSALFQRKLHITSKWTMSCTKCLVSSSKRKRVNFYSKRGKHEIGTNTRW